MNSQSIFIHCAFFAGTARYRIHPSWRGRINRQLVIVLRQLKHQALVVYCMSDQLHLVFRLSPEASLEELAARLRENSLRMINEVLQARGRFYWLPGYVANSIGKEEIGDLVKKIRSWDGEHPDDFNEAFLDIPANGSPSHGRRN